MQPDRFHQSQYYIAALFALVFGLLYTFGPANKAEALLGLTTTCVGFCVGKFSNGFKKRAIEAGDGETCPYDGQACDPSNGCRHPQTAAGKGA